MTIDRASVKEGARLAAEATPGPWEWRDDGVWANSYCLFTNGFKYAIPADAAFIAHWNPEFAAELVRDWLRLEAELADARHTLRSELEELTRLRRVEEAAQAHLEHTVRFCVDMEGVCPSHRRLRAALANPAAEEKA